MLKNEKRNTNSVGATSSRPNFEEMTKNNQKGITLIALIITIIVMLVLVGVTVNVALTGGLFEKGEKAAYQTNVATIKEQVAIKKAEILADENGRAPDDYEIDLEDLQISESLKKEFKDKLVISKDGELYYIAGEVNEKEKAWIIELGIIEGGTDSDGSIVGIYGNKQYTAIELLEGGVGYGWQQDSIVGDIVYSGVNGTITAKGSTAEFECYIIKDGNNKTINKAAVVIFDTDMMVFTTNGNAGGTGLDGSIYKSADGDTVSFENGQIISSLNSINSKYIYYMERILVADIDGIYVPGELTIEEDKSALEVKYDGDYITFNLVVE